MHIVSLVCMDIYIYCIALMNGVVRAGFLVLSRVLEFIYIISLENKLTLVFD